MSSERDRRAGEAGDGDSDRATYSGAGGAEEGSERAPEARPREGARIVLGEITAYRAWWVRRFDDLCLCSLAHDYSWKPAKFPAPHASGNVDELLRAEPLRLFGGVFSFKNPLDAKIEGASWLWWTHSNFALNCIALGSISIWGEVCEHERGYRAQFARVQSLDCIIDRHSGLGHAGAALDRLRDLYCGPRLTHREEWNNLVTSSL